MKIFIFIFAILSASSLLSYGQTIRSYMEKEIIGQSVQGSISEVPQHSGTWVEWSTSGDTITMMDGTQWKQKKSLDGYIHYSYTGTIGQNQAYTQFLETVFNKDYSKMNIRYIFGPIGMGVQMVGKYSYLGDGKQLAENWINMPDDE